MLARSLINENPFFESDTLPAARYLFFLFIKDSFPKQQRAAKCISDLLPQLSQKRPHLTKHALAPSQKDGQRVSSNLFPVTRDIVCVLDALDECEEES
jgi:hypothetical protein